MVNQIQSYTPGVNSAAHHANAVYVAVPNTTTVHQNTFGKKAVTQAPAITPVTAPVVASLATQLAENLVAAGPNQPKPQLYVIA